MPDKPNWTPGPWVAERLDTDQWELVADSIDARVLAVTYAGDPDALANMTLAAAAPELYEALEGLLRYSWRERQKEAAQSALAKARGETK